MLDEDHYDIEKVKDRILEFLAVRKLKPDARGSILCFAGPPGVGKTSLGQSVARALGRKFERISVGGVRDESEIRGHRRTYIGAMPGTIIRALRDAESHNPVFMIDEIDKMGADYRGDPASAMLEVLDPEQNSTFRDHYLDVPFDLSRAMFICTANDMDRVPGPLRDRMEVIPLAGYTEEEKLQIAKRYLVPRQIERNGLKKSQVGFTDTGLREIITRIHARGGRAQPRARDRLGLPQGRARGRRWARSSASCRSPRRRVRELLGRPRFQPDVRRRTAEPGVATGLAWTPAGGDVLFVEASAMPGKGKLTITGQLGDVMRESAQAALSYVRGHADLPEDWFAKHDVHVHVPAGAIPKDGPSAGITMATALMSLVSGRPVRDDVAMTGELTLTGQVLPIGGLKEKALAAQRAGIHRILAPRRNEGDLEDMPEPLRKDIDFVWVGDIDEVFAAALSDGAPPSVTPALRGYARHKATRRGGMAQAKKKAKKAAAQARANPYIRRIAEDEDLRQNIMDAYESARKAYARLNNGKSPFEADLRRQEAPEGDQERRRVDQGRQRRAARGAQEEARGGFGKVLLVGIAGAGVALAVSEGLRKKVLDGLFGAEEEFEYTSTTTASPPSNQTAGTTT